MNQPQKKDLPPAEEIMWLVTSWKDDEWPRVEGVFDSEEVARNVPANLNRVCAIAPIQKNKMLPDREDWPGAYYLEPPEGGS